MVPRNFRSGAPARLDDAGIAAAEGLGGPESLSENCYEDDASLAGDFLQAGPFERVVAQQDRAAARLSAAARRRSVPGRSAPCERTSSTPAGASVSLHV